MKHFYIISNPKRDSGFRYRREVYEYLTAQGADCIIQDAEHPRPEPDTEAVIVLGGDGTMLQTVRKYADLDLKYIGINTGHLGYLAEGQPGQIPYLCSCLLQDRYFTEERMVIYARVIRDGRSIARHRALNEITVCRTNNMKIVGLRVYLNGQFLTDYSADGLIVATPTGSTAYSFSVGGPIVDPTAQLFVLTPRASHSLNNRSLILTATDQLSVELDPEVDSNRDRADVQVYFDGDKHVQLLPGDRVEIAKATTRLTLIKISERSFVETLRSKMTV